MNKDYTITSLTFNNATRHDYNDLYKYKQLRVLTFINSELCIIPPLYNINIITIDNTYVIIPNNLRKLKYIYSINVAYTYINEYKYTHVIFDVNSELISYDCDNIINSILQKEFEMYCDDYHRCVDDETDDKKLIKSFAGYELYKNIFLNEEIVEFVKNYKFSK